MQCLNKNEKVLAPIIHELAKKIKSSEFLIDKTGGNIVELVATQFSLDPSFPILKFGDVRSTPEKYVKEEIKWYLSQNRNVEEISKHARIWRDVCDIDGMINSNYGWLIFSDENFQQFEHVLHELDANPSSRRAIMIYTRPSMWREYKQNGMNDFICTNYTQALIRNGELTLIVDMRSNDFIYGFFNDFYWQCQVYDYLRRDLVTPTDIGKIIWKANSLHVYERHFDLLLRMDWYCEKAKTNN